MNHALKSGLYNPEELLKICLDLHMYIHGSSDCLSLLEATKYRDAIQLALRTWTPSSPHCEKFDGAVRTVCVAVIKESNREDKKWLFA